MDNLDWRFHLLGVGKLRTASVFGHPLQGFIIAQPCHHHVWPEQLAVHGLDVVPRGKRERLGSKLDSQSALQMLFLNSFTKIHGEVNLKSSYYKQ